MILFFNFNFFPEMIVVKVGKEWLLGTHPSSFLFVPGFLPLNSVCVRELWVKVVGGPQTKNSSYVFRWQSISQLSLIAFPGQESSLAVFPLQEWNWVVVAKIILAPKAQDICYLALYRKKQNKTKKHCQFLVQTVFLYY